MEIFNRFVYYYLYIAIRTCDRVYGETAIFVVFKSLLGKSRMSAMQSSLDIGNTLLLVY